MVFHLKSRQEFRDIKLLNDHPAQIVAKEKTVSVPGINAPLSNVHRSDILKAPVIMESLPTYDNVRPSPYYTGVSSPFVWLVYANECFKFTM